MSDESEIPEVDSDKLMKIPGRESAAKGPGEPRTDLPSSNIDTNDLLTNMDERSKNESRTVVHATTESGDGSLHAVA